jgi:hypothetical protein
LIAGAYGIQRSGASGQCTCSMVLGMKGTPFVPHNVLRYTNAGLIVRLRDNETATIWEGRRGRKLPSDIPSFALRKLRLLNN